MCIESCVYCECVLVLNECTKGAEGALKCFEWLKQVFGCSYLFRGDSFARTLISLLQKFIVPQHEQREEEREARGGPAGAAQLITPVRT